jgi:hypothetical protein
VKKGRGTLPEDVQNAEQYYPRLLMDKKESAHADTIAEQLLEKEKGMRLWPAGHFVASL